MEVAAEEAVAFAYSNSGNESSNYYVQSPSCNSVVSLSAPHANYSHSGGTEYSTRCPAHHQLSELLYPSYPRHIHPLPQQPDQSGGKGEEEEEEEEEEDEDEGIIINPQPTTTKTTTSFRLSHCSSSRASVESLALLRQEEKVDAHVMPDHHLHQSISKKVEEEKYVQLQVKEYNLGWWKYLSFRTYPNSYFWISLQLLWRLFVSFITALLVFYISTKPPPPRVSVQVGAVKQFELAEGVDLSGVSTSFLNCNISVGIVIDNKSQVFGLAVPSPLLLDIYFGRLPLVYSQEAEIEYKNNNNNNNETKKSDEEARSIMVRAHERMGIKAYAGTKGKAMYGGGRNMEDMLKSGKGLPLQVSLSLSSHYDYGFIGWLIRPTFRHHARCLVLLLNFPNYNSTCSLLPY